MSSHFTAFCWAGPDQGIPSFSYLVGGDQGETEVGLLASIVPKQSVPLNRYTLLLLIVDAAKLMQ
jgi:hypothetical protein